MLTVSFLDLLKVFPMSSNDHDRLEITISITCSGTRLLVITPLKKHSLEMFEELPSQKTLTLTEVRSFTEILKSSMQDKVDP